MGVKEVKTTCPYCGVGCGVVASIDDSGVVSVRGDKDHPANYGRLCSKGSALADTLSMEGRLLYPEIMGTACSWDIATHFVANELQRFIEEFGPDSVAFYVSGQLLTEDYYVANKLMKGFIGSANIDTNSRLCMSSAVAAHKRAFGSDTVPGCYEDLERAKMIVLTGSNTAWCHPVLYQRIVKAKKENPDLYIVVIDPRKTPTCDIADLHLSVRPGTDAWLFNGLLAYLDANGEVNEQFLVNCTEGGDAAVARARQTGSVDSIADTCDLDKEAIVEFYRMFARTERVVTVYSQGINQSSSGTDKINSILNCHLLTGRIGRPGMGPLSLTGQPNAMGGREVGGLANQLTAHMEIANPEHRQLVQNFWQSPVIADKEGLKAVELFRAVEEGKIKAVWIMATNPVVSLPQSGMVRRALEKCELVIVSDNMRETDTSEYAHVLLPAKTWGERNGMVTNSERRMSRQRSVFPAPGEARADWWIVSEVAKSMGFAHAFDYTEPADIFREYAELSGIANEGSRDFNISKLSELSYEEYDNLQPVQWPVSHTGEGTARMFADGRFYTASGKAQFITVEPRTPEQRLTSEYPLVLNTGRIRDQWHTMTRTGKSSRLSAHIIEPFVSVHPADAEKAGIADQSLVRVVSAQGEVIVRTSVTGSQKPGEIFVPMHWNRQFASSAGVNALLEQFTDPFSGQPEFKHGAARIEPYKANWYGFILSRRHLQLENASYWSHSRGNGYWRYEIAGEQKPDDWAACARALLCANDNDVGWVEYFDTSANRYRAARLVNNQLESCVFIGPDIELPPRDYLAKLFGQHELDPSERASLLVGRPANAAEDAGPVVCACFGVGMNTLMKAIKENNLTTPEAVGEYLKAGTNCGSCVPEIRKCIEESDL